MFDAQRRALGQRRVCGPCGSGVFNTDLDTQLFRQPDRASLVRGVSDLLDDVVEVVRHHPPSQLFRHRFVQKQTTHSPDGHNQRHGGGHIDQKEFEKDGSVDQLTDLAASFSHR
ncbi:MAG: hypothetical protein JSS38_13305 [Nitrospira sp.]|nr:hypothetical protein [Nitrospira sp.]